MTSKASSDGIGLGESASTASHSSRASLAKAAARKAALKVKQDRLEETLEIEKRKVQLETDYMKEQIALQREEMEAEAAELERKAQEDKRLAAEKRRRAARQSEIDKRRLSHEMKLKNISMIEEQHKLQTELQEAEAEETVLRTYAEYQKHGLGVPALDLEESFKPPTSERAPSDTLLKLMSLSPLTDAEKGVMQTGVAKLNDENVAAIEAPVGEDVNGMAADDPAGNAQLESGIHTADMKDQFMEPEYQQQCDNDIDDAGVINQPGYEERLVDANASITGQPGYEDSATGAIAGVASRQSGYE